MLWIHGAIHIFLVQCKLSEVRENVRNATKKNAGQEKSQ